MRDVITHFPGHGTMFEEKYLEGVAEGKAEGKTEGKAEAVLGVLDVRGLSVPDDVRHRITTCTDLDRLNTWLGLSVTVKRAEDLFTGEHPAS
jgi:uncharacterized protein YcaQ